MNPRELLARLARHGVELHADGDDLRYRPAAALTPALLAELRRHKPAILAQLAADDPAVAWRVAAMRARHPRVPSEPWPFLTARDVPQSARGCLSCGEVLTGDGDTLAVRCRSCRLAVWLAIGGRIDGGDDDA